jgi:tRNA pseudouridine38-40 synthase
MRYVLWLSYCGTRYHGWQKQHNAHTVQAELDEALSTLLREPVETVGCGRTDTGVHARCYVAHFDSTDTCDKQTIYRLNKILPADIAVHDIREVSPYFHARFDASLRAYEYRMHSTKDPFLQEQSWYYPHALDIELMNEAAAVLLQYTGFQCFSKTNTQVYTYECTLTRAEWGQQGSQLVFHIEANRFLRNMVRAIVGTLLEVGNGSMPPAQVHDIIQSGSRSNAGQSVPAHGLYLTKVWYNEHTFDLNRKSFALEHHTEE